MWLNNLITNLLLIIKLMKNLFVGHSKDRHGCEKSWGYLPILRMDFVQPSNPCISNDQFLIVTFF